MGFFFAFVGSFGLPELLPGFAIKANHRTKLAFLFQRLREENFFAPNGGRGITSIGQCDFPFHIFGGAPFGRKIGFRCHTITGGATPAGPMGGGELSGCEQKRENKKTHLHFHGVEGSHEMKQVEVAVIQGRRI